MKNNIFSKNIIYRVSAYLLLIPFVPGIRPILQNFEIRDLSIFIAGFFLTLFFIIFSNQIPYIKISEETIGIYLIYNFKPEIHNFKSIKKIIVRNNNRITLKTRNSDSLEIRLSKKEQKRFLKILESKGIEINKA